MAGRMTAWALNRAPKMEVEIPAEGPKAIIRIYSLRNGQRQALCHNVVQINNLPRERIAHIKKYAVPKENVTTIDHRDEESSTERNE